MNKFSTIYPNVKSSVVAIVSSLSKNPEFPDIIGTGFIVKSGGLILTNDHVLKQMRNLPRLKTMKPDEFPIKVLYFHQIPGKGLAVLPLDVVGVMTLGRDNKSSTGVNYGSDLPDLGLIQVSVTGLPALTIAEKLTLGEGDDVMLAGFPMGTEALRAAGWLHQITPTLQSGIISAILPFTCDDPHAFIVNIMTQGGSSGSPVFDPATGNVLGIEYGGLHEPKFINGKSGTLIYHNNTTLTYVIPSKIINKILKMAYALPEIVNNDLSEFHTLEELLKTDFKTHSPKMATMKPINPTDLL